VEGDRFADELLGGFAGGTGDTEAGQVGDVCAPVFSKITAYSFMALSSDGDATWLRGMPAPLCHLIRAIVLAKAQNAPRLQSILRKFNLLHFKSNSNRHNCQF
jgi:hypothetical protein